VKYYSSLQEYSNKVSAFRLAMFLVVTAMGLYLRFASPVISLFNPDSEGYVYPVFASLTGEGWQQIFGRNFSYSAWVYICVAAFKNVTSVVWLQHFLGAFSCIIFWVFAERNFAHKFTDKRAQLLYTAIMLFVYSTLMLNGSVITFEKMLRPEGILLPFSVLIFIATAKLELEMWSKKWTVGLLLITSFVALCYLYFLFPRMLLGVLFASLLLMFLYWKHAEGLSRWKRLWTIVVFPLIFLGLSSLNHLLDAQSKRQERVFAFRQFYCAHAKLVYRSISDGNLVDPQIDTGLAKEKLFDVAISYDDSLNYFPILGYDLDLLQYGTKSIDYGIDEHLRMLEKKRILESLSSDSGMEQAISYTEAAEKSGNNIAAQFKEDYYKAWFFLIIKKYPLDLAKHAGRQILAMTFLPRKDFIFIASSTGYTQDIAGVDASLVERFQIHKEDVIVSFPMWFFWLNWCFSKTLIVLFPLLLMGYLLSIFRIGPFYAFGGMTVHILILLIAGTIITVAATHSFDYLRYKTALSPFLSLLFLVVSVNFLKGFTDKTAYENT